MICLFSVGIGSSEDYTIWRYVHPISPLLDFVFITGDLRVLRGLVSAYAFAGKQTHLPRISFRPSLGVLWIHLSIYEIGGSESCSYGVYDTHLIWFEG